MTCCILVNISSRNQGLKKAQNDKNENVLELVEYEQQYSGQFVVIYSTCQKLLAKYQIEGTGLKIDRFRSTILTS